ncbi:RES domain-containing protein [Chitinophaga skermanii]|uniref:RES domain-containing protein n=1 Tax=Chitinophaga skermanii TaxID=331697 RepID=A0A327Q449_9BACT|nr:RES family NAD+ phosphorylase [Chitinophaga skermanii]RAI98694.1 RES domain-containing protein [Chitinophaga skermanii]
MIVYRVVTKKFTNHLVAPGLNGRWNSAGKKVLYTAGSVALAALESMYRRNGYGFNDHFALIQIEIPGKLKITEHPGLDLPPKWNQPHDYRVTQSIGDAWYKREESPILKVPSAIIPQEFNYIINSQHPDFDSIKVISVNEFLFDEQLR